MFSMDKKHFVVCAKERNTVVYAKEETLFSMHKKCFVVSAKETLFSVHCKHFVARQMK